MFDTPSWELRHLYPQVIAWRVREILSNSQISFRSGNRGVAEAQLDLLQRSSAFVRQHSECAPEIMRSQLWYRDVSACSIDRLEDAARRHALCGDAPTFVVRRKIRPSLIPAPTAHASMACLVQLGIGTVRTRLPLPIGSTITQRASRSWI